ncbi:MAG TPA: autotransporter-associated beta strand repeat-containing protein [Verrucomicrobiae bacterium]|nr:autotransporter-associated beta strand repeat-containing protein [Verrucomicrobiae bacterium]
MALAVTMFHTCRAAIFVWTGGGIDANWSTAGNWSGGVAPTNNGTAAIVLAGTTQLSPYVDVPWSISSLTFSTNGGAFTLSGNALTIGAGGIYNSNMNSQVISNSITLGAAQTWNAASNNLVFAGNVTNSGDLLTVSGLSNTLINGAISGAGGLTKTGAGSVTLTASNSYSGVTTVSAGVMNIQNSGALGSGAGGTVVSSGAALQLQGGISVTGETLSLVGSGIGASGALRNISGSNSWSGAITLTGASTFDADAGTLYVGANIANGTYASTFTNNGTILLAGALGSGTGALTKTGTGTLVIAGANTYTGATTVSGGTLQFGAGGNLPPTSAVTINASGIMDLNSLNESILSLAGAGNVTLESGTLTVNNTAAATFSGVMSGTGGLVKASGAGVFTLSGANTYSGGTTIAAGAISIKADDDLGSTNGALTLNGGELTAAATFKSVRPFIFGANNGELNTGNKTLTLAGVLSGPGALTKIGSGTLTLTNANSYQGGTTNSAGTISINSDSALGNPSGPFTFSASATLTTTGSFTSSRNFNLVSGTATFSAGTGFTNTLNGVISGAGAMTQSGAGMLALGGNNTFTNTLTISKGTVQMGGNGVLSSLVPVKITAAAATFDLNNFNETIGSLASTAAGKVTLDGGFLTAGGNNSSTTNSCIISGIGGLTFNGTGKMILTGANTYTGTTTVGAGTLQLGGNSRLAATSPLVVSNGATFNMTNYNQTIASLAGAGQLTLGSGTLTVGNATTTIFSGNITGTGAIKKVGAGTQIFTGVNSYSGATTLSVGNLQVNGSDANSAVTIASAATLSGDGTVGTVTMNSGATNSPGTSGAGTLSSGSETWAGGGNYVWDINDALGTAGGSDGWDLLNIAGTLTITANPGDPFNIEIESLTPTNTIGQVTNFNDTVTYIWTIASASGGISGFNAANFNLITNSFQNPLGAGTFTLSQSGNNLNLIFTTAPEAAVQNVQSGTLTSTGNGTNTVTLGSGVNPTNAFLIFNTSHNSPVPGGSMIRGFIASSNSVEFVRDTTETSTMNIQWYVIGYSAGVRVQSGQVAQTNTIINVPLLPLSATNQAFVLWSKTPDPAETAFTDCDPVVGQITSISNLQFRVTTAPSSAPVIAWQVVEFQNPAGIDVQSGTVTNMTGTNLLATATLATAVNTNSTFILAGYRTSGSGTSIGARLLRAQLTSANTITFDRSISGAPDDVSEIFWQAVQLNDGSTVQSGSANFPAGVAQTNVTLASLNTNFAAAFASVQPVGGQNTGRSSSTGSVLGVGSATLALNSTTQLTLGRQPTTDPSDIGWQVVAFGPGSLLVPATGGSAISADTTGGTYTSLAGPTYPEIESGDVGAGTIILNAPAGFIFNTNGPLPTVLITRVGGSGANSLNINGVASGTAMAMTTVQTNALTFTVTSASSDGVTCSLSWQNISVQPAAGTPLASGSMTSSGTSILQGVTTNSTSWGYLNEVIGAAASLAMVTAPSPTATAGVDFAQQPVIQIQDQFGNLETSDNTDVVTVTDDGTGFLQGTTNITAAGGVATFIDLNYQIASTITLGFAANGLTGATSGNIVVSPAAASQLVIETQPSATATAGASFTQQPAIQIQDPFGNLEISDNSDVVTASLEQGSDVLYGTLTANSVNGVATFTNLSYHVAESITIEFTDGSLNPATCNGIAVNPAAASQLVIQTQPSPIATAGVPFAQQPVVQIQDAYGNVCLTNSSTIVTAMRDPGSGSGNLQGTLNVTATAGVVAYANLAQNAAGTISIDFDSGSLTGATSSDIFVNPSAATQLAFSTQPGSATVGSIFGIQPALVTQDAYGNNSVAGLASSVPVTLAITSGTGVLQGRTNLDIGTSAGNGAVAFTNLRIDSAGNKQLTASAEGLASAVSALFNVAQGATSVTLTSSENPSGYKDSIAFTASLPSEATGDVIFETNVVALSTNAVAGGSATSTDVSTLPRGTNLITAIYGGDGNYLPSTNTLEQVVTNHPPVASPSTYSRQAGYPLQITIAGNLATNWSDVDGDTVVLTGPISSTNDAAVSYDTNYVYYMDTNNVADLINYSITDEHGGTNTGVIYIVIVASTNLNILEAVVNTNRSVTLKSVGIPYDTYQVQELTNLTPPQEWLTIGSSVAGTNGVWQFTDTNTATGKQRYYRTLH